MTETLDLANLGTQVIEGSNQTYEAPSEFFRPPEPTAKGETTMLLLSESPSDERFYPLRDFETKEVIPGFAVNVRFKLVGGKQDSREFFAFIDTRRKANRNGNDVQDYLLGAGYTGRLLTVADYKSAMQSHFGNVPAILTWTGEKCGICEKYTVKKLKDFPLKSDGTYNHVAPCPDCGEEVGARAKIAMFKVGKRA